MQLRSVFVKKGAQSGVLCKPGSALCETNPRGNQYVLSRCSGLSNRAGISADTLKVCSVQYQTCKKLYIQKLVIFFLDKPRDGRVLQSLQALTVAVCEP